MQIHHFSCEDQNSLKHWGITSHDSNHYPFLKKMPVIEFWVSLNLNTAAVFTKYSVIHTVYRTQIIFAEL